MAPEYGHSRAQYYHETLCYTSLEHSDWLKFLRNFMLRLFGAFWLVEFLCYFKLRLEHYDWLKFLNNFVLRLEYYDGLKN